MASEFAILDITTEEKSGRATETRVLLIEISGVSHLKANSQFSLGIPVVDCTETISAEINVNVQGDNAIVTVEASLPAEISLTLSGPLVVNLNWASVGKGAGLADVLRAGSRKQESNGGVLHFEIIS